MKEKWTPHIIAVMAFVVFIVLGLACASMQSAEPVPYKPSTASDNVIGNVQATFEAQQGDAISPISKKEKNEAAYVALLQTAQREHQGNIDIRDITWRQGKHISGVKTAVFAMYEYVAVGKVILINTTARAQEAAIEGALARAAEQALKNASPKSKIAIVNITAADINYANFIAGELEFIWVNAGFFITDRSDLNRIKQEQNFQLSGDVDDATAVSIGKFAGADVIITGSIDGEGNLRRLRLRALNTETAQVIGVASERL
jgi:hypothetical protein